MSFDVFFIPSSDSLPEEEFDAGIEAAVALFGGVDDMGFPSTLEGYSFELFGSMFALRGWHDSMADLLFEVAQATSSFIVPAGTYDEPMRTPNNRGDAPGLDDVVLVSGPSDVADRIGPNFTGWTGYRGQVWRDPDADQP